MLKFRVHLPLHYKDLYFDFLDQEEAIEFAITAMKHLADNSDIEDLEEIDITIMKIKDDVIDVEEDIIDD